jgi:hypothetical protein
LGSTTEAGIKQVSRRDKENALKGSDQLKLDFMMGRDDPGRSSNTMAEPEYQDWISDHHRKRL